MIISKTPLRISLFGGGTDFSEFFGEYGGAVLSFAINKYIYVIVNERFNKSIRISYTKTEIVDNINDIKHELIRESLRKAGIRDSIEIITVADIPSEGSGLGSSSAITVGTLKALYGYKGISCFPEVIAEDASDIEINILHKPIGHQDQYITAFGGFRFIKFTKFGISSDDLYHIPYEVKEELSNNLLLFYTGITRQSSEILTEQQQNISKNKSVLIDMRNMTYDVLNELEKGNVDNIGKLLNVEWKLKKRLSSTISTPTIDLIHEKALTSGALGGKICGAGGGGFLLLYVPYEKQYGVKCELDLCGLKEMPFTIEPNGTRLIVNV